MRRTIVLLVFFISYGLSQVETNVDALLRFAREKQQEWLILREEAEAFARSNGLPIRQVFPDGTIIEIQRLERGIPIYYITENADAAITTRANTLWPGGSLGLSVTGSGYSALGEWDGGAVLTTHQEFGTRVTQKDSPSSTSSHATHVAGTMVAAGVQAQAKGMAYEAQLDAYDWNSDDAEMSSAAAAGLQISNHSYGYITGWYQDSYGSWHWYGDVSVDQNESYNFGFYDSQAQSWDQIAYDAPYYLIVKSAGNDRNDTAPAAGTTHTHNGSGSYTDTHYDDNWDNGGFDLLRSASVAKNVLTIGAVADMTEYIDASSVIMSSFSSWGPTDDGRIKPDIVANGVGLYSSVATSTTSYDTYSGTSMASPNAAGTLVLLQQHYQNTHSGSSMRAATLKALVIHTADEAGDYTGPDYKFGWGLLNAKRAAQLITDDTKQNVIDEQSINDGGSYTRTITASGNTPLKVTIVWTDPPGTPVAASLDPTDPMLVNDLDLRLTHNGVTYYPWKLDVSNPGAAATNNSENNIDNVEQVYIENPEAGSYTITVDHDGTLTNGSQAFSIIISGIDEYTSVPQSCSADLISPTDGATDVPLSTVIEWEPVDDATSYDLYFGTDGGGTTTPTNIVNGDNQSTNSYQPNLQPNTTYYVQVVPRNNQGTASGCATIWSFTTENATAVSTFPYTENFDSFTDIGAGNDWYNATDDDIDWSVNQGTTPSSGTGPNADHTSGSGQYLYVEASSPNYPNKWAYLHSNYFNFSAENNPTLEFWYNMYGAYMGNLYVDVYANGQWNTTVYALTGEQSADGDDWKVATIHLNQYKSGDFQRIRFRGITGDSYQSDIAIDDVTIRGESFHTFLAGESAKHTFENTGASVQFTTPNSGQITLEAIKYDSDPGVVGSLPSGVVNVAKDRYWKISLLSGTVDGTYSLSLDLAGMAGINDYATLYLLKRTDSSSPWTTVGANNYSGSGTVVEWTGISSGFSEFAIGGASDNSLPVQLSAFQAQCVNNGIKLTWQTESEMQNQGFIVYKKTADDSNWTEIASYLTHPQLKGQGTVSHRTKYSFVDTEVIENQTYYYRLGDRDLAGKLSLHQTVEIVFVKESIPETFTLKSAYPNPFNPAVTILYGLPEKQAVRLEIFDLTGRRVVILVQEEQEAGWHSAIWNGKNSHGSAVGSGTYIFRISAGQKVVSRKIVFLK
ncbi:S8 family serine peptidase [Calditrichota bacterium LG25]